MNQKEIEAEFMKDPIERDFIKRLSGEQQPITRPQYQMLCKQFEESSAILTNVWHPKVFATARLLDVTYLEAAASIHFEYPLCDIMKCSFQGKQHQSRILFKLYIIREIQDDE